MQSGAETGKAELSFGLEKEEMCLPLLQVLHSALPPLPRTFTADIVLYSC